MPNGEGGQEQSPYLEFLKLLFGKDAVDEMINFNPASSPTGRREPQTRGLLGTFRPGPVDLRPQAAAAVGGVGEILDRAGVGARNLLGGIGAVGGAVAERAPEAVESAVAGFNKATTPGVGFREPQILADTVAMIDRALPGLRPGGLFNQELERRRQALGLDTIHAPPGVLPGEPSPSGPRRRRGGSPGPRRVPPRRRTPTPKRPTSRAKPASSRKLPSRRFRPSPR